jgi:hypothetical protein
MSEQPFNRKVLGYSRVGVSTCLFGVSIHLENIRLIKRILKQFGQGFNYVSPTTLSQFLCTWSISLDVL